MQTTNQKKGLTLFVVVAMSFLATLDSSIVNIALPVMSEKLNVPLSAIEWVVASYIMIICSTLLFFGRLGDIVGKPTVFRGGTVIFIIGTFLCGMCQSFHLLIVCRFIQGIGAAAYMANNQGIITQLYPNEGRGKALGILAAAVALGTMTGAPLGGFIVSLLSWNYIFYVNVPIGTVVFLLGLRYLPHDTGCNKTAKQHIDIAGSVLQFLGTILLFSALIDAQRTGFSGKYVLIAIPASVIFIAAFILLEKRQKDPLMDLSLFRNHMFSLSLVCATVSFICIAAYTLLMPFYLEKALKLSPSMSGLLMMTAPLIIFILSPVFGTLADKIGSEILTAGGLIAMGTSFFLMSFFKTDSSILYCVVCLVIMATGQALFQPANNSLIMSSCPKNKLGIGGSINSLVRNFGQYLGIVLSTTLLYAFMSLKIGHHVTDYIKGRDNVFIYGMKNCFLILLVFCAAGTILTVFRSVQQKKETNNGQS